MPGWILDDIIRDQPDRSPVEIAQDVITRIHNARTARRKLDKLIDLVRADVVKQGQLSDWARRERIRAQNAIRDGRMTTAEKLRMAKEERRNVETWQRRLTTGRWNQGRVGPGGPQAR